MQNRGQNLSPTTMQSITYTHMAKQAIHLSIKLLAVLQTFPVESRASSNPSRTERTLDESILNGQSRLLFSTVPRSHLSSFMSPCYSQKKKKKRVKTLPCLSISPKTTPHCTIPLSSSPIRTSMSFIVRRKKYAAANKLEYIYRGATSI